MNEWACRKCFGLGMVRDDEGKRWVLCDCPTGESKRRFLNKTPDERRREKRDAARKKKKQDDEPIPHWVKE